MDDAGTLLCVPCSEVNCWRACQLDNRVSDGITLSSAHNNVAGDTIFSNFACVMLTEIQLFRNRTKVWDLNRTIHNLHMKCNYIRQTLVCQRLQNAASYEMQLRHSVVIVGYLPSHTFARSILECNEFPFKLSACHGTK